jgi:hypothetical protein
MDTMLFADNLVLATSEDNLQWSVCILNTVATK